MMRFYKTSFLAFLLSANLYAASNTPDQDDLPEISTPLAALHLAPVTAQASAQESAPAQHVTNHRLALVDSPFDRLPDEVILKIFQNIPFENSRSMAAVALTCKLFYNLLLDPSSIGSLTFPNFTADDFSPQHGILAQQRYVQRLILRDILTLSWELPLNPPAYATSWPNFLPHTKSIESLHLMEYSNVERWFQDHPTVPSLLPQLTELKIYDSKICGEEIPALVRALESLPHLTRLNLSKTYINPEHFHSMLTPLKNLTSLYLSSMVTPFFSNAATWAPALTALTNLKVLDLSNNRPYITNEIVAALVPALTALTNLEILDLSNNYICAEDAIALAGALVGHTNLSKLSLCQNQIGFTGAPTLVNALQSCTSLKTLDLSSNAILDEASTALADALSTLTSLTELNLANNFMYNESRVPIQALKDTHPNLNIIW